MFLYRVGVVVINRGSSAVVVDSTSNCEQSTDTNVGDTLVLFHPCFSVPAPLPCSPRIPTPPILCTFFPSPTPQSCSPLSHLGGPIPAPSCFFTHPCNPSLLLCPCSLYPCPSNPVLPSLLPCPSLPSLPPYPCSQIIPATPFMLLCTTGLSLRFQVAL